MAECFNIRGTDRGVWCSKGQCSGFYELALAYAEQNPDVIRAREIASFSRAKFEAGAFAFDIAFDGEDSKPVEFWMSLALVIEKLTIEELPRARPPVYLRGLINWQDDARCRWRSFLENLYNLINEALPNQNKLPQLAPWKFTPSPQLGAGDDFLCPLCGEIVKEIDEICRGCGASWPHKLNQ